MSCVEDHYTSDFRGSRYNSQLPANVCSHPDSLSSCNYSELLRKLSLDISKQEQAVDFLLRAFDIDHTKQNFSGLPISNQDYVVTPLPFSPILPKKPTQQPSLNEAVTLEEPSSDCNYLPDIRENSGHARRSSENPFLLTPLRLKHFPGLSPSILRSLLRSPSIRIPTPDASLLDLHERQQPSLDCPSVQHSIMKDSPTRPSLRFHGEDRTIRSLRSPLTASATGFQQFSSSEQVILHNSQNIDQLSRSPVESLDKEFRRHLLRQANEAGAQADELGSLMARLMMLAERRRELVDLLVEKAT